MDGPLKRTIAMLLAGGAALFAVGLAVLLREWLESGTYTVDFMSDGTPPPEVDDYQVGLPVVFVLGCVMALGGVMSALTGAVAAGVWLGSQRRDDQG
ncbi:uncharacterized protein involved in exopolysaccharide biosynthesis [Nocardioides sp. BE266]|uniref:hypothetical protein n=1 Tax=Nocardioides sp. BE266 TaxID=2817725 RepID=UPI002862FD58|nr:hypothetical protein [Nocardioides sp. BE266]MDR7251922.1 uncharacterized protein involved in exopolysaccharide biosynthesis [Nocardioides sp. BE266]